MTEAVTSSSGRKGVKQESEAFGFFDSLDILATIATQELKSKSEDKELTPDSEDDVDSKTSGKGSSSKKFSELETFNLEQLKTMSGNTLLKTFTDTDFDEMKRMYCYTCYLQPSVCSAKFQSFGNESKAKKEMRQHLLECVERIVKEGNKEFLAEAVVARKRRGGKEVGVAGKQAQTIKKRIKSEPQADSEAVVDKDNNETSKKPTETSNEQESKRTKVKNELTVVSVESVNVDDESDESRKPSTSTSGVNNGDSGDGLSRAAVDEDHCYAVAHGRVKAEYWPEYDNNAATAFTSIQENDETYENIKEVSDLANADVIQSCPVVLEEDYNMNQEPTYQQEFIIDTTPESVECIEVVTQPHEAEVPHEFEETQFDEPPAQQIHIPEPVVGDYEVYQDPLGDAETYYTETVEAGHTVVEVQSEPIKPVPVRIKNKRTVAAVSNEDKRLALNAMEELRSRGATTDDLMCRLCDPPRPFTAYSTLLTHYRSHAGLRPFECGLCGATFTRQHSLNYHLMTHANQTRFTCPHCNRKFRHPTHFKEHVKKHGEVVQFLCQFCNASLSTQSQYRKHLKKWHNKTIDIMGNVIDGQTDAKDKDKARRKRKATKDDHVQMDPLNLSGIPDQTSKRKRRKKVKDEVVAGHFEEVSAGAVMETGTVLYEETVPLAESELMYQNSEVFETQGGGYEFIDNGSITVIQDNKSIVQTLVNSDPIVVSNASRLEKPTTTSPKYVSRVQNSSSSHLSMPVSVSHVAPVTETRVQPSPVVFVVPNYGQRKVTEADIQNIRKPLMVNEQKPLIVNEPKKPIIVSNFQASNSEFPELKQGVIAHINGQKVLLVPKKKDNVVQLSSVKTSLSSRPPAAVLANSISSTAGTIGVIQNPKRVVVAENQENDADNKQLNAANATILEQAMHEVFPSSLESSESNEKREAEGEENGKEGIEIDLYNPMRSPLKNRNQILCEVLGIDS